MIDHWEFLILGFVCGVLTTYAVSYVVLSRVGAPKPPQKPIYGPADPYRRDGQQVRPNVRVV